MARPWKYPQELVDKALSDYDRGLTLREVEAKWGLPTSVTSRRARAEGLARWNRRHYTIKQKRRAIALKREGYSGPEVERLTGVKASTVNKWARELT